MLKTVLLLLSSATIMIASPITLHEIMQQTKAKHPLFQAKVQQEKALEAQAKSDFAADPFSLGVQTANASPKGAEDEREYSLGLSKNIALFGTKSLALLAQRLQNDAILINNNKRLISLSNHIQNLYHQSCLDSKNYHLLEASLAAFETLYAKKERAYKYKEISKKELLQLQMQLREIKQKVHTAKAEATISKERLYDESELDTHTPLSCQDLTPMVATIRLKHAPFMLSADAFGKEMQSLEKLQNRYNRPFESLDVAATYDDEIDTKRIGVGFSLPLSFSSSKNEYARAALLHQEELQRFEFHNKMIQKMGTYKALKSKLQTEYDALIMIEENLEAYKTSLMPLVEKSFAYGESSVIEYILAKEQLLGLSKSLIERQKSYYNTLFNLYTTIELEKK